MTADIHQFCHAGPLPRSAPQKAPTIAFPGWFTDLLADRAVRKPSPHTTKAHRQDFGAIATLLTGTATPSGTKTNELSRDTLRAAFAAYADIHSAASIRRCWSTWNTLCTFLFTAELLEANPMPLIGHPNVPKTLPKSYPASAITELVTAIDSDDGSARRSDWSERDRAIMFTSVHAVEQRRHSAAVQDVDVVDAVRPRAHARRDRGQFRCRFADPDLIRGATMRICSPSSLPSPVCWANVITVTNPAHDTGSASSNTADSAANPCETCTGSAFPN